MQVRISFTSEERAKNAARLMPCPCNILSEAGRRFWYLEFSEAYYEYYYQYVKGLKL